MRRRFAGVMALLFAWNGHAQDYQAPKDPLVREKLDQWQDLKFGLMMHWGVYAQWGIVESWTLCSEDQPWCSRGGANYVDYVRDYEQLITTFNPEKFDPELWADAALDAGMRYLVFTTKHHDGFCLFDTDLTQYRVTGPACAFRHNPRANVTLEVFNAFREKDFWIGTYFSKPDWNHDDYWAPQWATPNRCNNYDTRKYPERWKRFQDFTYGQIEELMTGYGPIDILWLDGGWVRPNRTITDEVRAWGYDIPPWEQDVDIPRIAKMARKHQPGLVFVDRSVHGPYENYRTPEQRVPDVALPYPWETCMSMSQSWSWVNDPEYKSVEELVHTLVDIVAKGGNLLLNVGPSAEGVWDPEAYDRLRGIGEWMKINREAIYGTRVLAPYQSGDVRFTQKKTGERFVIYLGKNGEAMPPSQIRFSGLDLEREDRLRFLEIHEDLPWQEVDGEIEIEVSQELRSRLRSRHAWVIEVGSGEGF